LIYLNSSCKVTLSRNINGHVNTGGQLNQKDLNNNKIIVVLYKTRKMQVKILVYASHISKS